MSKLSVKFVFVSILVSIGLLPTMAQLENLLRDARTNPLAEAATLQASGGKTA